MNYRGHHVTLIQNNRHVCVPFLVSTKNYGIYWDNYSHTEFDDSPDGMTLWSEVGDGIDYYFIAGPIWTMSSPGTGKRRAASLCFPDGPSVTGNRRNDTRTRTS